MAKLEVTIEAIVHSTEDITKFFDSFKEIFDLEEKLFSKIDIEGHFENSIVLLQTKISKKSAAKFFERFNEILSESQKEMIIQEMQDRTENSTLHIRFDKQEFVKGKISFAEKDAIKLKIHTPIYNKKDTVKVFSEILQKPQLD